MKYLLLLLLLGCASTQAPTDSFGNSPKLTLTVTGVRCIVGSDFVDLSSMVDSVLITKLRQAGYTIVPDPADASSTLHLEVTLTRCNAGALFGITAMKQLRQAGILSTERMQSSCSRLAACVDVLSEQILAGIKKDLVLNSWR